MSRAATASTSVSSSGVPGSVGAAPVVAGYDLVRVLGQGGMGVVWEALEHRLDRSVALKVCSSGGSTPEHAAKLWSEARLAAKIGHPGVVPVHDFGYTIDGRPYYTMELVPGTELRSVIKTGQLEIPRALAIAREIAEAVAAGHERGILHRDLKSSNVLIDASGHARILDFGLAVPDGDPRAQETQLLAGSPPYMAPERFQEKLATGASDVYAIGVMLYEMLVGERPVRGTGVVEIFANVLTVTPDRPSARRPEIHPDLDALVMRCLEKDPAARWPTARGLAVSLLAVIEGRPVDARGGVPPPSYRRPPPPPPPRYDRNTATPYVEVRLDLRAAPEALWPHVANTDRFNRAAGLGGVDFVDTPDETGMSTTTGAFRTLGMNIAWEEHPFEWVRGREHSVYREYTAGPLRALWNRVTLTPREGGGTRLVHEVRAIAGGVVGRLAAQFELKGNLARRFHDVYGRLDAALAEGPGFTGDPFEPPHAPSAKERDRIADVADRLVERHGLEKAVVERLTELLLYAPAKTLERLRPWVLASAWGADPAAALDVMLAAAGMGLLQLCWDLVCPRCQVSHELAESLGRVTPRAVCPACSSSYDADLASTVELVFRPHASLRAVDTATYCVGAPARRPHVVAQQVLAPGEERAVVAFLPQGPYRVTGPRLTPREFAASSVGWAAELAVVVQPDGVDVRPTVVRAGDVRITLANMTMLEQVVRIEDAAPRADAVTASTALAHPRFRELFSGELLPYGEHVSVSRAAFVFLDVPGRFELLEQHGDAGALGVAARLDTLVAEEAASRQGSIVESGTNLAQVVAFPSAGRAVEAAIAIMAAAKTANLGVRLRAAVHEGKCIALTRGGRVDWFGDTILRGAALLDEVEVDDIALSFRVAEDREALAVVHAANARTEVSEGTTVGYGGRRVVRIVGAGR